MSYSHIIKERIKSGELTSTLLDIYADESLIEYQIKRYVGAIEEYERLFEENDGLQTKIFSAPGRVEIGGNHTDHQHGEVLAAAINLDAIAITSKTDDGMIRIISEGVGESIADVNNLKQEDNETGSMSALVKGVLLGLKQRGYNIGGFNAYVTSDVNIGSGLSSSAAFEVLICTIISHLYNDDKIDSITTAIISQYAENKFFGKPCGLMDQMACSVGNLVHVDFADVNNPVVEKVDFDLNSYGYSLCITDTKGSHANLTDEYAAVPDEMKKIASYFNKEVLAGISFEDIINNIRELREKYGDRAVLRAIHFITENNRVKDEVTALKNKDIDTFLNTVEKSGDSSFKYLQNVYVNSDVTHQNVSIGLAASDVILSDGSGVARVHGGGFAGTIQAFVKNERVKDYSKEMDEIFGDGSCRILKIRKYGGINVINEKGYYNGAG
ncbi:MAG: galactokinase [Lachnospiraceae bacterium]|nr:galactokinase [Lachnospiraceae bacterium]